MGDTILSIARPPDPSEDGRAEALRRRDPRRTRSRSAIGPAGTGKTYLAVAMAVKALRDKEV